MRRSATSIFRTMLRSVLRSVSAAQTALKSSAPILRGRPALFGIAFRRSLFVETQPTPNPDALKFVPAGRPILPPGSGTVDFPSAMAAAHKSPLAKRLFRIEGVKQVFIAPDFLSITKESESDWANMKPEVFATIMEFFSTSTLPAVYDAEGIKANADTIIHDDDDEVVATIKELLETRIRPVVQDDGGDIAFRGFDIETGVVSLEMKGSCAGCPSSTVTLKHGIESMLQHYVPEVVSVEEYVNEELEKVSNDQFERTVGSKEAAKDDV